MLGDIILDDVFDVLADSVDSSHPVLNMLWEDSSFLDILKHSETDVTWNAGEILGASDGITNLFDQQMGTESMDYHVNENGTTADIMRELVHGHRVIAALDISEFVSNDLRLLEEETEYDKDTISEIFGIRTSDKAIWITEVDASDPNDIKVVINDARGDSDSGKIYSLSDFVQTWDDAGFRYIATDTPPPNLDQIAIGFDAETGTFPEVATYFESQFEGFLDATPNTSVDAGTWDDLTTTFAPQLMASEVKLLKAVYEACERLIANLPNDFNPSVFFRTLTRVFIRLHDDIRDAINSFGEEQAVETQSVTNATVTELIDALEQNAQMWLLLDIGEDTLGIASIDLRDPTTPHIVVNASGNPNYAEQTYSSIEDFTAAWADARFHYITMEAEEPPMDPAGQRALDRIRETEEPSE